MLRTPKACIWIFEDDSSSLNTLLSALKEAKLSSECDLFWSLRPNAEPRPIYDDGNFKINGQVPLQLCELSEESFRNVDVAIVDLQMPEWFRADSPLCPNKDGESYSSYKGLYTINYLINKRPFSGAVLIASAQLSAVQDSLPREFEKYQGHPKISRFSKGRNADGGWNLIDKIFAIIDLKKRGYSCSDQTRESLFLIAGAKSSIYRPEPILILGKSGSGKENAAAHLAEIRSWHARRSKFRCIPMQSVHCGSLTANLARSELFGYVKGAFTGADSHSIGTVLASVGVNFGAKDIAARSKMTLLAKELANASKKLGDAFSEQGLLKGIDSDKSDTRINEILSREIINMREGVQALNRATESVSRFLQEEARIADGILQVPQKGAGNATGYLAAIQRTGLFSIVDGDSQFDLRIKKDAPLGTLFFDEFGDLAVETQSLLLRFIDYGECRPFGYPGKISLIDDEGRHHLRVICATNNEEVRRLIIGQGQNATAKTQLLRTPDSKDTSDPLQQTGVQFRPDLIWRAARWVIDLPDLIPEELDAIIDLEQRSHGDAFGNIVWPDEQRAVVRKWIEEKRFSGQRRELRTILMRAMTYASEMERIGTSLPGQDQEITNEILDRAIQPIKVQTSTILVPMRSQTLQEMVRMCLSSTGIWLSCPSKFNLNSFGDQVAAVSGTPRIVDTVRSIAFLLSACLTPDGTYPELQVVEAAWGSGKGSIWTKMKNKEHVLKAWFCIETHDCKWSKVIANVRSKFRWQHALAFEKKDARSFVVECVLKLVKNRLGMVPESLKTKLDDLRETSQVEQSWSAILQELDSACKVP